MRTNFTVIVSVLLMCFISCANRPKSDEKMVLISTKFGDMKVKLYNETPLHRDNFLKLVENGDYNDLLFHRVIKGFMVQGGDPESKGAPANKRLGSGGPGYQIDAEIVDGLYHKKGALSAARQGDQVNPERKSSGSQFYIVQGETYTEEKLKQFEDKQRYQAVRKETMKLFQQNRSKYRRLQQAGKMDSISALQVELQQQAETIVDTMQLGMTQEQREIYTTVGGTPHLDGGYTVFGEVVEGLNIIDSIANVKTGAGDRPVEDVKMTMKVIK